MHYKSARVELVLKAAQNYAHISARVAVLNALNKPRGKLVGDRIAAMHKLRTQLELLELEMSVLQSKVDAANQGWIPKVNWENEH
jgi:hypothetical protein